MKCAICDKELVTRTENETVMCTQCLINSSEIILSLKEKITDLEIDVNTRDNRITLLENIKDQTERTNDAERKGGVARDRFALLDENPFDSDSDEAACWSYGWMQADLKFSVAEMQALLLWVMSDLSIIKNLLDNGVDKGEISDKMSTLISKSIPYLPTN